MALRRRVLRVAAQTLAQVLDADTSDGATPAIPCGCGGVARYVGRRAKTFMTVLGPLTLRRAYYHCRVCRKGVCPRDRQLDLEGGSLSPGVTRMVGLVGATASFEEGRRLLAELAGVEVGVKRVERAAKRLGNDLAAVEHRATEPEGGRPLPPTLHTGMDGTGVPIHSAELAGRAGKQPDGSARTREVNNTVKWKRYSASSKRAPDSRKSRSSCSTSWRTRSPRT